MKKIEVTPSVAAPGDTHPSDATGPLRVNLTAANDIGGPTWRDLGVELKQRERVAWYAVFRPGGEVVLRHGVVEVLVDVTDAERPHDEVGKRRGTCQRHTDVTVQTCRWVIRPVLLAFDDTVFHKVRQKHDLSDTESQKWNEKCNDLKCVQKPT